MTNNLEEHFSKKEHIFFEDIKHLFKPNDVVLKIGNGFGYLSTYVKPIVKEVKIFEIHVFDKTINKDDVILYDGKHIPVEDDSCDVAIFNLVFHHIPENMSFLKQTAKKTKRIIILYEQTYDNIFQKIQLVWRDWYINLKAGTPSTIHWNSYLKRSNVESFVAKAGLQIVERKTKRSHSYYKELIVLSKRPMN